MTRVSKPKSKWPLPVDTRRLYPEERVKIMFEMSSAMGEIVLDSIRDKHPGISEALLLNLARKRIDHGRRLH